MLAWIDRAITIVLLIVHAGLLVWAVAGFAEMAVSAVPWSSLSNPLFSPTVLFLQWTAIALGAAAFLFGYALRWRYLPQAMIACYAFMASVCAYETVALLTHSARYTDMALEYVTYIAIVVYLFVSPGIGRRIGRQPLSMPVRSPVPRP